MRPRRPQRETTCRGFGERREQCQNPPGTRVINDGRGPTRIPSLCATCDLLRIQIGREIARAEGRPISRGDAELITGLDFTRLDTGVRTKVRRAGR